MADQAVIRDWLKALGTLVAGSLPANESRAKLNLLAPMLAEEFPAGAFTPASLAAVARQCKFFPSYAEICEVLSPWWKEHRPPHRAIAADQNATIRQREIEREVRESWDGITAAQVRAKVKEINGIVGPNSGSRVVSVHKTLLASALAKHAPEHLALLPPQWLKAYQELPEVAEQREVSLRRAALEIRPETRKGPPIGDLP